MLPLLLGGGGCMACRVGSWLVSVEDSDSSPGSHLLVWWVIGGCALSVSKVPHTPKREGPMIRDGLWGPPLFLCAGGWCCGSVASSSGGGSWWVLTVMSLW